MGSDPGSGPQVEAHEAFRFVVELGSDQVYFSECTLPTLEVEVLEQKEGGYNTGTHRLPGPVKLGRITLKDGVVQSKEMLKWYSDVASGNVKEAQRNISVVMYDSRQQEVMRLNFARAYPVKWTGPMLKTSDSSIAIETLELAFAEVEVK